MGRKQNSKKGFSFVEVCITIFIIGIVLVLYIRATNTIRMVKTTKHQEIAVGIANNKIEELRAGGYDNLPSSGNFSNSQLSALPSGSGTMNISSYNSDTKEIRINVAWQETGSSIAKNISLTTLITKTGGI